MKKFLPLLTLLTLTACFDYSDGTKVGTITQFSKKGFFCKTWEGQLLMGGLKKETQSTSDSKSTVDTMVANTMDFTVEDPRLIPAIQKAMENGERVQLDYQGELITFCRSDSNRFVKKVKE